MDDDQEEMLEPLGLGITVETSPPTNAPGASAAAAAAAAANSSGGTSGGASAPKIKYAIEV